MRVRNYYFHTFLYILNYKTAANPVKKYKRKMYESPNLLFSHVFVYIMSAKTFSDVLGILSAL